MPKLLRVLRVIGLTAMFLIGSACLALAVLLGMKSTGGI